MTQDSLNLLKNSVLIIDNVYQHCKGKHWLQLKELGSNNRFKLENWIIEIVWTILLAVILIESIPVNGSKTGKRLFLKSLLFSQLFCYWQTLWWTDHVNKVLLSVFSGIFALRRLLMKLRGLKL